MQFVFQPLAWGFLLVLAPVLIHLINLLRYRRQNWAAMQFLLESYKRHRRWVWLKQALLLLTRMAAIAVLVAMLAQWVSGSRLLSLLGETVTHHYVLIDDSMSMGQGEGDASVYARGVRGVAAALDRTAREGGTHQLTAIRFSRAAMAAPPTTADALAAVPSAAPNAAANAAANAPAAERPAPPSDPAAGIDAVADVLSQTILGKAESLLGESLRAGTVDLALDGTAAIRLTQSLLSTAAGEQAVVYYVSDFRQQDWQQAAAIKSALQAIERQGATIELIDSGTAAVENVSLLSLRPDQEVLAAGVPVLLRLSVRNQGLNPLRNVSIRITSYDFHSDQLSIAYDQFSSGRPTDLPPVVIESLEPGEMVTRAVQVVFPESGSHVVSASIGDDPLRSDNRVACVLNLVERRRLLVIDDSLERSAAQYLQAALDPGGTAPTGWTLEVESSAVLRDASPETIGQYAAILLADWNTLDPRGVRNLQQYLQRGGGVAVFPGRNWTVADAIRVTAQLNPAESTAGGGPAVGEQPVDLLPVALRSIETIPPPADPSAAVAPLQVENHPIFAPLLSLASSPFQFVRFAKVVAVADPNDAAQPLEQIDAPESLLESGQVPSAIARLADGRPLLLDHAVGRGHLVLSTVALDPSWTNWSQDPSFVVVMLKLAGYLASFRSPPTSGDVADVVRHRFAAQDYLPDVEVVLPAHSRGTRQSIQLQAMPVEDQQLEVAWNPVAAAADENIESSLAAGTTELWLSSLTRGREVVNFAANAPAAIEGPLQRIERSELLQRLSPLRVRYRTADAVLEANPFTAGGGRQTWLLGLLILLLLIEQALAYAASYHLPRSAAASTAVTATAGGTR